MATSVTDIKTAIINKLNGISFLNGVYGVEVSAPTNGQYPFATVIIKSGEGKFGDTIRNLRKIKFHVNCYQERLQSGQGDVNAENIVVGLIDEVMTAFDADTTLSGLVNWVQPVSWDASYVSRELGDTRFCQIVLEAMVLVPSVT